MSNLSDIDFNLKMTKCKKVQFSSVNRHQNKCHNGFGTVGKLPGAYHHLSLDSLLCYNQCCLLYVSLCCMLRLEECLGCCFTRSDSRTTVLAGVPRWCGHYLHCEISTKQWNCSCRKQASRGYSLTPKMATALTIWYHSKVMIPAPLRLGDRHLMLCIPCSRSRKRNYSSRCKHPRLLQCLTAAFSPSFLFCSR